MKSNNSSHLPNQDETIKQPLISSLKDPSQQNQKIDVMKLMDKQEQLRVTKVDFNSYRSITKNKQDNPTILQKTMPSNNIEHEQEQTHNPKTKKQHEKYHQNRTTQTFLNNYESNNSFIGFALYIVFMVFISAEVLTSAYYASRYYNSTIQQNKGILLILFSQLVYYLLVRVLSTQKKLYRQFFISPSIKNMFSSNSSGKFHTVQRSSLSKFFLENPYIYLSFLLGSILFSQAIYCWIATQSLILFEQGSFYLVSSIYWSNFVLPLLITHFQMNRHYEDKNWKIHIFPYLLGGFILELFLQSSLLVILSLLKIIHSYLQTIQGKQIFHINQLTKIALLIIWCMISLFSIFGEGGVSVFKQNVLKECFVFCVQSAVITFSFILSRLIATIYIKNQLHRYFYTQTHLNLAYIFTTILMYATYINFQEKQNQKILLHCILATCFLALISVIIYLQGKQKEQLTMQISLDEQQL